MVIPKGKVQVLRHCQGCHENFGMGASVHENFILNYGELACGLPPTTCVKCQVCPNCGNKINQDKDPKLDPCIFCGNSTNLTAL